MVTVQEATATIQSNVQDFGIEQIPLNAAIGRILRKPIKADRELPPFDRVTMDGIAIKFEDFDKGIRTFPIKGVAAAGAPLTTLTADGCCLEVMTGAMMPENTDTVIRYEDVEIENERATITIEEIKFKQNVHFQGLDRKEGEEVISPGQKMASVDIAVCATFGNATVSVSRVPKTIVIYSGDELVEIDETPLPHQIRASNVYRLKTELERYGSPVETAHLPDDYELIVNRLKQFITEYELIVISGGVSKGKFDYLPKALEEVGVTKHFHRIKQRPGKPFWFGTVEKTTVFAFPGNPVSSFMCMHKYLHPWMTSSLQAAKQPTPKAVLAEEVHFKPDLTYFLEVRIDYSDRGELLAYPVKGNGSGDLANLTDADAFIELPMGKDVYEKGEVHPLLFYR